MTDWTQGSFPGHEVNVVLARGIPLDTLTRGLLDRQREPLASGEADGWAWAVHDMHNWDIEDYDDVEYGALCPNGAEIVVFVTEPCSVKGFPPAFEYYRDGRLILRFNFEDLGQRVGANPDYLSPELLAADLIGPRAGCGQGDDPGHDCFDDHGGCDDRDDRDDERLVKVITDYFALPSPPLSPGAAI
ncbi:MULTISPECIES: hypothetical protein [unclassified Streptomyces]|uniref:hypothetical protein n=1 Tax=unclassified Streptomyces TaxID=2593676 RepID=UPI0036EABF40